LKHPNVNKLILFLPWMVFCLCACSAATPTPTAAPDAPISGQILFQKQDKTYAMSGVKVMLFDEALVKVKDPHMVVDEVETDKNGRYAFPAVKPGKYSLGVTASDLDLGEFSCATEPMQVTLTWMFQYGTSKTTGEGVIQAVSFNPFELKEGDRLEHDLTIPCK
jgi:hypothetical protein